MIPTIIINLLVILSTFGSTNFRHDSISKIVRSSLMDEIVDDILRRCFVNDVTDTIVFIGKSTSIFTVNTTLSNSIAIIQIENPKTSWKDADEREATFSHGLPLFVLSASEEYSTKQLLLGLRKTSWWNHASFFIALDRRTSLGKICCIESAREVLLTIWKMDILSSIFLCTNYANDEKEATSPLIYTYNPYEATAPIPWTKVETHIRPDGHPWTLFEQAYDSEKTTCDCLKFVNKTFDLSGFKISANVKPYPPYLTLQSGAKKIDDLGGTQAHVLKSIWRKLNASISLTTYESKARYGDSLKNGTATGIIADLVYGKCDINLNLRYIRTQRNIRFSVAQSTGGLSIVTNHRGWKSSLTKIADFINVAIVFAVLLVCFVAVLVAGYSPSRFILPDIMNVIRLFLSTGTYHLPRPMPQRLVLFACMFMVFVINSVFQGKLAGLLTSPISSHQIDTLNDIEQFGYEIYGFQYISEFIPLHLSSKFHNPRLYYNGFCADVLANNSNAACIAEEADLAILMTEPNLYISKEKFASFHTSHTIRKNWPLYDRFNRLLERLVDSGLIPYWESDDETSNSKRMNMKLSARRIRALKYRDLRFSFKMLAVGLTLATAIFFTELCLKYRRYAFKPLHLVKENLC